MYELMPSPETALGRLRLAVVRELLLDAVQSNDALTNHRIPSLEAFYWTQFGPLEISLYETELKRDQTAFRIRLIRQYLNRAMPIDLPTIQAQVAVKFAGRIDHLAAMHGKLTAAEHYLALPMLSARETDELNNLYKQLIKALHPDLHPHQSSTDARLFLVVLDAYANGMLAVLQTIATILDDSRDEVLSPQALRQQLTKLLADLANERVRTVTLYQQWPLNIEQQLHDESWRAHHRAELQLTLNKLKQQVAANIVLYGQLVGDLGGEGDE